MIEGSKIFCDTFKPFGSMTVQLIRDNAGVDLFIKTNPCFGGALSSMKAGERSAEVILKLMDGDKIVEQTIADGAVYSLFNQSVYITEGKG